MALHRDPFLTQPDGRIGARRKYIAASTTNLRVERSPWPHAGITIRSRNGIRVEAGVPIAAPIKGWEPRFGPDVGSDRIASKSPARHKKEHLGWVEERNVGWVEERNVGWVEERNVGWVEERNPALEYPSLNEQRRLG
jgi:hypothetical protein